MDQAWGAAVRRRRLEAFRWRYGAGLGHKILLGALFASATGAAAQLRIPLPFTPVPITLQTLAVLASGLALGRTWGAASQLLYVAGGLLIPWYAGFGGGLPIARDALGLPSDRSGLAVLMGATAGYLVAFPIAAGIVGWACDRRVRWRSFPHQLAIMVFGSLVVVAGGSLFAIGAGYSTPDQVLAGWILPFLPGDLAKAQLAALAGTAALPKVAFNGELDRQAYRRGDLEITGSRGHGRSRLISVILLATVAAFWTFLLSLPPSGDPSDAFPVVYPVTVLVLGIIALLGILQARALAVP